MTARSFSLSRRLVWRLTLALGTLWLFAMAASALAVRDELDEIFDSALQETAQRLLPLALDEREDGDDDEPASAADSNDDDEREREIAPAEHAEYLVYQLRDAAGRVLLRSHDAPHSPFAAPPLPGFAEIGELRLYGERAPGGLVLQVAERLDHRDEAMSEVLAWLAAPLLLLVPLAAAAIWWTVAGSLRPVGRLRDAIRRRGGGNLEPLPEAGLPDELQAIVLDVNRLLGRLDRALQGERAFAANSAHELRTPIAAALAQTQRLAAEIERRAQDPAAAALRPRVEGVLESLRGLSGLAEKLLQLARAESGLGQDAAETDLLPVVRLLVEELGRTPSGAGRLSLDDTGLARLPGRLDLDAFGIVLRNLVDNALRHGLADGPVLLRLGADRSVAVVSTGPVVPPERLAKLGTRFERAGATASGSGLGLAIAGTILRQAGGRLELSSPAPGRTDGFEALIRLP